MKVFVAGASGAVGRPLVRQLVAAGHDVVGTTRSVDRFGLIRSDGGTPVAMDALDADQVQKAVVGARPHVVIHQLTSLTEMKMSRHFDRAFAMTNRLRTQGLDLLLDAARTAGATRFIAQSYAGWPTARTGRGPTDEADPLDAAPAPEARESLAAIRHAETTTVGATGVEGVVLRFGPLYGPGTNMAPGGDLWEAIRARKVPMIGSGGGVFSFLRVEDAAAATVLALDHGSPGIYNVVDDDPAPVATWLPYLCAMIGAKPPQRIPAWLARPLVGRHLVMMMTAQAGVSNAKAKRELGFAPHYPSWRAGFTDLINRQTAHSAG
jgi:nucleoside-diphosphate-sugar epimerase